MVLALFAVVIMTSIALSAVKAYFLMLMLGWFASVMGNDVWALGFWQTLVATLIVGLATAQANVDID